MKVLVTGANGQVGWELVRALQPLGEVVAATRQVVDFGDPAGVGAYVDAIAPDLVVNAAAYTAVDRAEDEPGAAYAVNRDAVAAMAHAAKNSGALLVHLSTDYVFDGSKRMPYSEGDDVCPLNVYGESKLAGEQAIAETGGDWLVFRTSWVYASRGQNFLRTMLKLGASRETLSVVSDQFGAPTSARTIADLTAHAAAKAIAERRTDSFGSGLYHMTARGTTTWHAFAEAIFAGARRLSPQIDLSIREVKPIPAAAYPAKTQRPAYSVLDNTRFDERFGLHRPLWSDGLALVLEELFGA
ncbi:dTDP-4-dehydrorhamnose reductase [Burkholderia ubonensis]|uniref:dTDP-4-dehydrorhamnose reductase n=1 Tax=Burkholderia ubonensis TaxID=101571 RepID=UPI00075B10F3|nr:dTDP-4-dehydrorhamnose reductase [Burkholderia ubonensis]KVP97586.1 dTDP-4-dehydrorhamnose reductase [Burkholderia ubonensis]KVT24768.1 dTDP-4-dehydrorhamnose reductase [Burkholderia ubonensis]KVU29385.1 dTDP-4-dehydrorhamnose reductase [Burkholderia ubonensis]KVW23795.1 dTDP-4-dehydrorhamnose reductase [Burkholderia ubonensis]KVW70365.1 dTDP-4-dehydrorhamnose reductase [Burkholderia ubonensis]